MRSGARAASLIAVAAIVVTAGVAVLIGGSAPGASVPSTPAPTPARSAQPAPASSVPASAASSVAASAARSASAAAGVSPSPSAAASPPAAIVTLSAPPSPTAPSSPGLSAAPTSAARFDPRHTVVPIAFPLPATARYRYGAAWRVPRLGVVYSYNQIRGVTSTGALLRAHDGVDLLVPIGTIVSAPFAGVVVDPAKLWRPWDPARYGRVVVIRSTEAASRGYLAMLVHLSRQSVSIGQTVKRGTVVGRTGISGNASETAPHLHVELRAPFRIEFHYAGVRRLLDVFDPMPSLLAADPRRRSQAPAQPRRRVG